MADTSRKIEWADRTWNPVTGWLPPAEHDTSVDPFGDGTYMLRVNREIKHLTRLLDGQEHNELPTALGG